MQKFMVNILLIVLTFVCVSGAHAGNLPSMKVFTDKLLQLDGLVCKDPEKIKDFYLPDKTLVLMVDDKRTLLSNRIAQYNQMKSELRGLKCNSQRKLLTGSMGDSVGYVLVDEISSIVSSSTDTDERQHSVCTYAFNKVDKKWKIALEHCSSLPDYSIRPGDDALYYFHNPVY
jgi:hypothetical protein